MVDNNVVNIQTGEPLKTNQRQSPEGKRWLLLEEWLRAGIAKLSIDDQELSDDELTAFIVYLDNLILTRVRQEKKAQQRKRRKK